MARQREGAGIPLMLSHRVMDQRKQIPGHDPVLCIWQKCGSFYIADCTVGDMGIPHTSDVITGGVSPPLSGLMNSHVHIARQRIFEDCFHTSQNMDYSNHSFMIYTSLERVRILLSHHV